MKKIIIFFLVLVLLSIGGIATFQLLYKPKPLSATEKQQALTEMLGRKVNLSPTLVPTGWTAYSGKYIALSYPQAATVYDKDKDNVASNPSILEKFEFYQQMPRWDIVALVTDTHGSLSLDDNSGVLFRERNPDQYVQKTVKIGPYNGLQFTKGDKTEVSTFFLANGHFYSIAMTGALDDVVFQKVLASVQVASK